MPEHPGRSPDVQALSEQARASAGIPQGGAAPGPGGGGAGGIGIEDILLALQTGQLSAAELIELLTLLSGGGGGLPGGLPGAGGLPGGGGVPLPPGAGGGSPIEAAFGA